MRPAFLKEKKEGVLLLLHVQPGARRPGFKGIYGDRLKLAVDAPPVDGKANRACRQFLARFFKVPKSSVELVSGASSRKKVFFVSGLSAEQAERRLSSMLK